MRKTRDQPNSPMPKIQQVIREFAGCQSVVETYARMAFLGLIHVRVNVGYLLVGDQTVKLRIMLVAHQNKRFDPTFQ